jgi:hypothetical protein
MVQHGNLSQANGIEVTDYKMRLAKMGLHRIFK